jgi:hypothetical protein
MKGTFFMAANTSAHFAPARLDVQFGAVTQLVASLENLDAWAARLADETSWGWAGALESDPFQTRSGPQIASAADPDRNLDGAQAREQLALFSGHSCDVWNGVLWPALIALPELAAVQYLPTSALPPLERQLLAIGVGVVQTPDVLLVVTPAVGLSPREKAIVLRRLAELAEIQKISVVLLSQPHRALEDQVPAIWLN